ncbi:MAG: TIM44-like domain-containing protein [Solirubrobacterales bacterium]
MFDPLAIGSSSLVPVVEAVTRVYCSECDPDLPFWQEALLASLAISIASGILYLIFRVGPISRRMRNLRLGTCFLSVQRGWEKEDPAQFAPFVTYELGERLRRQLAEIAADGKVIHHERPRLRKVRVVSGGGRKDDECVARIESSVRHWLADATSGELVGGSKEISRDESHWRFIREPATDWLAAEIGVTPPAAGAR